MSGAPADATIPSSRALPGSIAVALTIVYLVWGSTYLAIRWVVQELPPMATGAIRFFIAGAVFLLVARMRGGPWSVSKVQLRNAVLMGAAMPGLCNGLVSLAARGVSSSLTALLLAMMPIWLALITVVRPGSTGRPTPRALLGLVLGFAGTALLVLTAPDNDAHDTASPMGMTLLIASALIWAAFSLFARSASRPTDWMVSAGLEMCAGGLFQGLIATFRGEWPLLLSAHPSPRTIWAMVYLVAFGAWLGYGAFSWLTRNARPALVATYAYVNPLVAVALGSLVGGEALGARIAWGGGLVVVAVVLVTTAKQN